MRNLIVVAICFLLSVQGFTQSRSTEKIKTANVQKVNSTTQQANREQPNPNRWIAVKTFVCTSEGYSISVMRKADHGAGQSEYKIQVEIHGIISEYCSQTRRNILANAYRQNRLFAATVVENNAAVGDYCDNRGNWITGTVYRVSYPSQQTSTVYATNILHNSSIEYNLSGINDLVSRFNTYHSYTLASCFDQKCSPSSSGSTKDGALAEMKKLRKLQKDLIKAHTDFLESLGAQQNEGYLKPDLNKKTTNKKVKINN